MSYRALPPQLHAIADKVRDHFRTKYGVVDIRAEEEIGRTVGFRPTLRGRMRDQHILCVEVTDENYSGALDSFVLDCERADLPVKLYIAIPDDGYAGDFKDLLRRAQDRGIGVIEVGSGDCHVHRGPLSLSLTALRKYDPRHFPMKYRQPVSDAREAFLNGDPVKGCSKLYDEIEAVCRRVAEKVTTRGLLRKPKPGQNLPKIKYPTAPWANVMRFLLDHLDFSTLPAGCKLDQGLISRILGLTPHRNESGHKPRRREQLIRRDRELRTRFEHAADTLSALLEAVKCLRI